MSQSVLLSNPSPYSALISSHCRRKSCVDILYWLTVQLISSTTQSILFHFIPLFCSILRVGSSPSGSVTGNGDSYNAFPLLDGLTQPGLPQAADLSKEDRMLLDRAKWLVSRFNYEGEEGEVIEKQVVLRKGGDRDRDREEGDEEDSQGQGGVYIDRQIGEDLIPFVSQAAEDIRNRQHLFERTGSFEDGEGYDLNVLSSGGRTSSVAASMLLSFVDFLSEVNRHSSSHSSHSIRVSINPIDFPSSSERFCFPPSVLVKTRM